MTKAKSSIVPRMDLIPIEALIALADRYELGEKNYGHNNWRFGLTDPAYVRERAAHIIIHTYKLIAKLEGLIPVDGDDDAAAIMWGGAFLICALKELKDKEKEKEL